MASDLEFRTVPAASGDAADMLAAMVAEMRDLYDGLDLEAPGMPKAGPAELGPPDGVYLVGYRDGAPVFLAKSNWELGYIADRNPGIRFTATKERG